jgi:hypothetical protein
MGVFRPSVNCDIIPCKTRDSMVQKRREILWYKNGVFASGIYFKKGKSVYVRKASGMSAL